MNPPAAERLFDVVITSVGFPPGYKAGGPIKSVTHIISGAPRDVRISVVTRDRDLGDKSPYPGKSGVWVRRQGCRVFYLSFHNYRHWIKIARHIRRHPPDLLYLNSVFMPTLSVIPVLATRLKVIKPRQILIAPRGELSPGALALKSRKKRWFIKAFRRLIQGIQLTWHASTVMEEQDIRGEFPQAQVIVNCDQIELGVTFVTPMIVTAKPRFVFVGRITPKKGLDIALQGLTQMKSPASFDIFGPAEDAAYWESCKAVIRNLPPHVVVTYRGELLPDQVVATFAKFDAFVFPTRGENFGHVIAESLQASCPVICSDQTPWTACLEDGGGWVIGKRSGDLATILNTIAIASGDERAGFRRRSREAFDRWQATADRRNILQIARDGHLRVKPTDCRRASR